MYKILGADDREYGPVSLEQFAEWAAQGRINPQTRVLPEGAADWVAAADVPELREIFARSRPAPTPGPIGSAQPAAPAGELQSGLAVTSLVLGILGLICLGPLAAIPAIICGHIAHNRTRRAPTQFGGGGMAIAGFVTGYVGLVMGIFLVALYSAMLLPALSQAKNRAQSINCANNMKMIGLAFRTWSLDHEDQFPFNVSTNTGGTLELCQRAPDGFDLNSAAHFLVLSNELNTPVVLVCPSDGKKAAANWSLLQPVNVSYKVRSGPELKDGDPQQVLAVCPIHNTTLYADGTVQQGKTSSGRRRSGVLQP